VQLVGGDAELLGDLGVGGAAMEAVLQGDVGLLDLACLEPDRPWDPVDGSQLVDDRALDPRDRVGLELDARSRSYFSIASIRPKMPYDTRSACSMFGGRPTETRPATYLTSGA
jgi:hypothetical protein